MSLKRIVIAGAVAVSAVALVGGGYAAAQNNDPSTTLITSSAAETTGQAYRDATTSQLTQPGVQTLAASYAASCSATTSGTTITVTVSGSQGTPTGTVTFTGYDGTKRVARRWPGQLHLQLRRGRADHQLQLRRQRHLQRLLGSKAFAKATPTCTVTRSSKTVTISVSGSAGRRPAT